MRVNQVPCIRYYSIPIIAIAFEFTKYVVGALILKRTFSYPWNLELPLLVPQHAVGYY